MTKTIFNDLRLFFHDLAAILTVVPFVFMIWQQYLPRFSAKQINPTVLIEISKQENKKL